MWISGIGFAMAKAMIVRGAVVLSDEMQALCFLPAPTRCLSATPFSDGKQSQSRQGQSITWSVAALERCSTGKDSAIRKTEKSCAIRPMPSTRRPRIRWLVEKAEKPLANPRRHSLYNYCCCRGSILAFQ
jgi:hypothetical protein